MTIRERKSQLMKRMAASGFFILAVGGATASMIAAPPKQDTAELLSMPTADRIPNVNQETTTEPTTAPQRGQDPGWSANEEYIAARMAMAEAEGEDTEGKALVILVIYNRTRSGKFPDTVKGVISQRNAFTSYSNGRYDRVEPDVDCWAALDLIQETGWDESQGALYFERTPEDGESTWHSRNLKKLFTHGNHTFYTEKEVGKP